MNTRDALASRTRIVGMEFLCPWYVVMSSHRHGHSAEEAPWARAKHRLKLHGTGITVPCRGAAQARGAWREEVRVAGRMRGRAREGGGG